MMAQLRSKFTIVEGLPAARAQTGERYVTFMQDGERAAADEGREGPPGCATKEDAACGLAHAILAYADRQGSGTLYWRIRPEVEKADDGLWYAYARLLISDKPAREEAA
jgi:hypothetical protein